MDTGKDKVQKICDLLKKETLLPAQEEAKKLLDDAHLQAEKIITGAKQEAQRINEEVRSQIENEKNIFQASMQLASKQAIGFLKQEIEKKLFNEQLGQLIEKEAKKPEIIAELISAIAKAIEKEGLDADLLAIIPFSVSQKEINALLAGEILRKLKDQSVAIGDFSGGAQVKIADKHLTIDITDEALKQLLATYIREDFRELIFQA